MHSLGELWVVYKLVLCVNQDYMIDNIKYLCSVQKHDVQLLFLCTALAIASHSMNEAISGERALLNPNCLSERGAGLACLLCGDEAGILEDLLYGGYLCGWTELSELSLTFFGMEASIYWLL